MFNEVGLLELCLEKWNGVDMSKKEHWKLIKSDPKLMGLIFQQFFEAFDTDHSGSVSFGLKFCFFVFYCFNILLFR